MQQRYVIHELAEGFTMPLIGNEFFSALCKSLLKILDVDFLSISKIINSGDRIESLSYCSQRGKLAKVFHELKGTASEEVITEGKFCHFASGVQKIFPEDSLLRKAEIESFAGIPVFDRTGKAIGLISAMNTTPTYHSEYIQNLFMVVAKRVELEMERLIYEEKLQNNQALLNNAQQIANFGNFEWEINTNRLTWSDQLYRIYGYAPNEVAVSFELYLKHILPPYHSKVKQEIEKSLNTNSSFDHEYEIVDKFGRQKILHSIGQVVIEEDGSKKLSGVCHDITKNKRTEYELKQLNAELENRVKKRTESLEKSLGREKLIREISEFTVDEIEKSDKMLQQAAVKVGQFLEVDGLQIVRINNEYNMEFFQEGNYFKAESLAHEELINTLLPHLKVKRFNAKNVHLLVSDMKDLPEDVQERIRKKVRSLLVFEFFQNNKPYGLLLIYQKNLRKWSREEFQLIEEILIQLGSALFKADILVKKNKAVEEYLSTQNKLKLITDGAPAFISYLDKDLKYQYVNKFYLEFFGIENDDIVGKNVKDILNRKTYTRSARYYNRALLGEKIQFENIAYDKNKERHEIDVQFIPEIQNGEVNGIIVLATVITGRKKMERRLKESEERMLLALEASSLGAWDFDLIANEFLWDKRCKEIFGLPQHAAVDYDLFLNGVHPEEKEFVDHQVKKALHPGNRGVFDEEFRIVRYADKEVRWIKSTGRVMFKGDKPYRFIGISQDISKSKMAEAELKAIQQKLEYKNRMLETLQHVGNIISGELEHKKVVQTITDAATAIIGAEFGAFIDNAKQERKETYHLITLSGMSFSSFDSFPIPRDAKIFAPTFKGERIVRYDDISREEIFANNSPYLKSYLAVPVFSKNNKVLGGLFFGHSEPGVFTTESEKILEGIAPQAAIALDNAGLYDEARLAKQQAEQQRNMLYNIFDHAPSFISLCKGKDFIYEFVNKEYDKYWPKGDLLGQSLRKKLIELNQQRFVRVLDNVYHSGQSYNGKEVPIEIVENGKRKTLYFDFIIQALRNDKGEPEGIISYATDISEQVYARKTIEEFMSVASHELKTPLTTVMAYSELLEEELNKHTNGKNSSYISKMNNNLNRLNNLISDLLDVSRIKSGKMLFKKELIDFDKFISESLENIRYTAKSHAIILQGKSNAQILGDGERLEQVVTNIVSNAIKYSPKADKILVKVKNIENKRIEVDFVDFGLGIPKEKMDHLFQRFYRIEEKGTSGLGIGLYISKEIVENHKGRITVQSNAGDGATFKVSLPIAQT